MKKERKKRPGPPAEPRTPKLKVGFYGPISQATGYGAASRAYVHALHRAGIELSVVDLNYGPEALPNDALILSLLNRKIQPDFHLVHHYAPQALRLLSLYSERLIAITTWETDMLPVEWVSIFNRVREVWVPCAYNVTVFRQSLSVPVFKWPYAVELHLEAVPGDSSGLPELRQSDFVFYAVFVWQQRKYPEGIIEAFLRAFPSSTDVILILKVLGIGPAHPRKVLKDLRQQIGSEARVSIITEMWSEQQLEALSNRGDCYVSLHRSEGWCYPLFDAACRGKPIIATGYSGPMEYLNAQDHLLVRYKITTVERDDGIFYPPMKWAKPDLTHATELMRQVYEHRQDAAQRDGQLGRELKKRYSLEAVGKLAKSRLEQIICKRPSWAARLRAGKKAARVDRSGAG
jgi:glycosyltransferase involved in cell wall biosynthesis